jgi:glutaminase
MNELLKAIFDEVAHADAGKVPTHIPLFKSSDVKYFAISVALPGSEVFSVGDSRLPFSIQSIGKVFTYLKFLERYGESAIKNVVEMVSSPFPFNSLEMGASGKPHNPMSNAGSLALWSYLLAPPNPVSPNQMTAFVSGLTGDTGVTNELEAQRALSVGVRNREIAEFLKAKGLFHPSASKEEVLEAYYRQCFMMLTTESLAKAALKLATNFASSSLFSVLLDCGLYEYSSTWKSEIGLPAKSAVSGALMILVPGKMGVAIYAPGLDGSGNSVRGRLAALRLVEGLRSAVDITTQQN